MTLDIKLQAHSILNRLFQGPVASYVRFIIRGALVAALTLACTDQVAAQSVDPTAILQSIPPAVRDSLFKQIGKNPQTPPSNGVAGANQILSSKPPVDLSEMATGKIMGGETLLIDLLPLYDTKSGALKDGPLDTAGNLSAIGSLNRGVSGKTNGVGSTSAMPPDISGAQRSDITSLSDMEKLKLNEVYERLMRANPYEISKDGSLLLPGMNEIRLLGLTASEVQTRLALDPVLQHFQVGIRVIKIAPSDAKALHLFGYDLFKNATSALVPGTDVPAPDNYMIANGDQVTVQLYGQTSQVYTLPVNRDGNLNVPELGPVNLSGLSLAGVRSLIEARVAKQLIGTKVSVTLGELHSLRVLVVGDAQSPGTYVVSGLSNASSALFASGGVKPIGSLRNIEIKRDGKLLGRLDFYDVLLNGDTRSDIRLQSGDVVFVPPIGKTAGVAGEIKRPAIYELLKEKTAGSLLALAGGTTVDADLKLATIERTDGGNDKHVINVNLDTTEGLNFPLHNGDILRIPTVRPQLTNGITIEGEVYRTGTFAYRKGIRVSDLLSSLDDLKLHADTHYLVIRQQNITNGRLTVRSVDLEAALKNRGSPADVELQPRDRISVFDLNNPRDRLQPLLSELRRQSRPDEPAKTINISGSVNAPGEYPLEDGMHLADAIRAGGGLKDQAYAATAELTRYTVDSQNHRKSAIQSVNLEAALRGDPTANVVLSPYDNIIIQQTPRWSDMQEVELFGEVEFPGRYRIEAGETLAQLLKRAGGLTERAFPKGTIFLREDLKQREQEQLDRLASRLQATVLANSTMVANADKNAQAALAVGQALVEQVRSTKAIGRLVVNMPRLLSQAPGSDADVRLRKGDRIVIPPLVQEVSVLGEVENPTSHLFRVGMTEKSVIDLSGGYTIHADKSHAYVLRADGSVAVGSGPFRSGSSVSVEPGDTVVVPVDSQQLPGITKWQAVTGIVYNLAIAVSSLKSLGVL
jgi:polysaccharide biosynthesis/export protein